MDKLLTKQVLDLGCGTAKVEDAIGVDNADLPNVDIVHDLLAFPYPFDEATIDEVYLRHVVEHFSFTDMQRVLAEVHRILAVAGIVHIHVPHVFSVAAWVDPTHRQAFTFGTINFFEINNTKAYYEETENLWMIEGISAWATCFNWKRYRLRQLDKWISLLISRWLNYLLTLTSWPGAADLLVKFLPLFFVEIRWCLRKVSNDPHEVREQ